jgi:catechol 2,3-dioxygenase-like lactoylglutathione lyase family enzyme
MNERIDRVGPESGDGHMTRRDFALRLGALATTASRLVAQSPPRPTIKAHTLNHLAMGVSDVERTADWYQKIFGMPVRFAQDASAAKVAVLRIADGPEFLELFPVAKGAKPGFVHLGFGVQRFNRTMADQALNARGIKADWQMRKAPEGNVEELTIRDPDDLIIQIQDTRYAGGGGRLGDTWSQPWRMPTQTSPPPVAVRCINHATFGSASKERVERFYQDLFELRMLSWDYRPGEPSKILGFVADSPRQFIAPGQGRTIGISHYCLGVETFDYGRVAKAITDLGIMVPTAAADRKGCCGSGITYSNMETLFVRDPDGISVQLTDMNYCAGQGPIGVVCIGS